MSRFASPLWAVVFLCAFAALGCSDNHPAPPPDAPSSDIHPGDMSVPDLTPRDLRSDAQQDLSQDQSVPGDLPVQLEQGTPKDGAPKDGTPKDQGGPPGARIVTFNLHCLQDQPAIRAEGIAQEIVKLKPDVVGLQEVCETIATPGDNFAKHLAALLTTKTGQTWTYRFAMTHIGWGTFNEGVGLLARQSELVADGAQALPQGSGPFPRKVIWGRINTPRSPLLLYSTHLTISSNWRDRDAQAAAIVALAKTHQTTYPSVPQIVVGDFNDKPWTGPIQTMTAGPPAFVDTWKYKHPTDNGFTISSSNPQDRIDYIFVDQASLKAVNTMEVVFKSQFQGVWLSDHLGLFADVAF